MMNSPQKLNEIKSTLQDPNAVHANMLRGNIAWTPEKLRHLLGDYADGGIEQLRRENIWLKEKSNRYREAFRAACDFIDCHVGDNDITREMRNKHAQYEIWRTLIEGGEEMGASAPTRDLERENNSLRELLAVAEQMDGIETLRVACEKARAAINHEPK